MAVADIEAAPASRRRSAAARAAAWAVGRFLSVGSHVALMFLLSATFMCGVGNAMRMAARLASGEGSVWRVMAEYYLGANVVALCLFFAVAFVFAMALLLHCFVMAQLLRRRWSRKGRREIFASGDSGGAWKISLELQHDQEEEGEEGEEEEEEDEEEEEEEEEDDGRLDGVPALVTAVVLPTSLICMAAGYLLTVTLAPATRGTWEDRLGSALIDAGFLLVSLTYSYVLFPTVVLAKIVGGWEKVRKTSALLTSLYLDG